MKKKFLSALVLLLTLCFTTSTFAVGPDSEEAPVSTDSVLSLSCGLTHNSGSSYTAWATATSSVTETITVNVRLYRVVGSTLTLITSGSNTVYGTSASVSRTATLSAGSYRVVASASGSSSGSVSTSRNYTVS